MCNPVYVLFQGGEQYCRVFVLGVGGFSYLLWPVFVGGGVGRTEEIMKLEQQEEAPKHELAVGKEPFVGSILLDPESWSVQQVNAVAM